MNLYESLFSRARQARDDRPAEAPFGFAMRIVANRPRPEMPGWDALWLAVTRKALVAGLAACLIAVAFCYDSLPSSGGDDLLSVNDSLDAIEMPL